MVVKMTDMIIHTEMIATRISRINTAFCLIAALTIIQATISD